MNLWIAACQVLAGLAGLGYSDEEDRFTGQVVAVCACALEDTEGLSYLWTRGLGTWAVKNGLKLQGRGGVTGILHREVAAGME